MGIDNLKTEVSEYVEKKTELKTVEEELLEELQKLENLKTLTDKSDTTVQSAVDKIHSSYMESEAELEKQKEELDEKRVELTDEAAKEKRAVEHAKSIIESINDNSFAHNMEVASQKSDEVLNELDDLLNTLNEGGLSFRGSYEPNSIVKIDETRYRTDDNGQIHMRRDADGQYYVLPSKTYTVNGYTYRTDESGRIVSAEGTLKVSDGPRKPLNVKVPDMRDTDQRGHIIADRFGGSNMNDNLVAQLSEINDKQYRSFEEFLARLQEDHVVHAHYSILYGDDTKRPSCITVDYSIDGVAQQAVDFLNNGIGD